MAVKSLAQSSLLKSPNHNSMLGDYESNYFHHLETVRLSSTAASISFTNLERYADFEHLQIRMIAGLTSGLDGFNLTFNGDTNANYSDHPLYADGTSVYSAAVANASRMAVNLLPGDANVYGGSIVDFLDAFSTTKYKTVKSFFGESGSNRYVELRSGSWRSLSAISSISMVPNSGSLKSGSRFSLYGFKVKA